MAITTYVLLTAFASGLHSRWDPELLGTAFTKALLVVAFECAFIKLGCYLLGVSSVNGGGGITDLLGWTGYKFVEYVVLVLDLQSMC
jgi:protein transport protein YIF1